MHVIKHFLRILSIQTFVVIALSFVATYICLEQNWVVELPTTLIGIAIVFPIVFSINAAYRRREGFCIAGFYSLVLVSLDNIQELLENPYDEVGVDDINLNVGDTYANLMIEKQDSH